MISTMRSELKEHSMHCIRHSDGVRRVRKIPIASFLRHVLLRPKSIVKGRHGSA